MNDNTYMKLLLLTLIMIYIRFVELPLINWPFKGGRMGRSDKVSLWCVALLINTRFSFFILE